MDIEYLLSLQNFRNAISDGLTPFLEGISLFAVTYLVLLPAFIYWCIDKRSGLYTLSSFYLCIAVNAVVKLTACVYRPWIRDIRIRPAGDAITTATGYSFPSGHTSTAVPIYGGMAVSTWKRQRWIAVLCIVFMLLTGFSRNYLGVHTPQDVAVAVLEGLVALTVMSRIFKYLDRHPEKENWLLLAGIVLGFAAIIFITNKGYPADYDANGQLRVDPFKMMKDGYGDIGALIAFCIGRYIEKTWVKFEASQDRGNLAAGLVGCVIAFFLIQNLSNPLRALLGLHWGTFAFNWVIVLFIVCLWPAVMKAAAKSSAARQAKVR